MCFGSPFNCTRASFLNKIRKKRRQHTFICYKFLNKKINNNQNITEVKKKHKTFVHFKWFHENVSENVSFLLFFRECLFFSSSPRMKCQKFVIIVKKFSFSHMIHSLLFKTGKELSGKIMVKHVSSYVSKEKKQARIFCKCWVYCMRTCKCLCYVIIL